MTETFKTSGGEKDLRNGAGGGLRTICEDEPDHSRRPGNDESNSNRTFDGNAKQSESKCQPASGIKDKKITPHRTFIVNKIAGVLVATILVALIAVIFNDSFWSKSRVELETDTQQIRSFTHDNPEKSSDSFREPPSIKPPPASKSNANSVDSLEDPQSLGANIDFLSPLKKEIIEDHGTKRTQIAHIDEFNNIRLLPRLRSIVGQDYFRYVKLNLTRPCRLWPDDHKCALRYDLF